ncbi:MAG: hypothetical protein II718_04235 [Clostridiales bacterium]|nr:hypothetical protein [Clostridiales bacterium]
MKDIIRYIRWIAIFVLGAAVVFWGVRISSKLKTDPIDISDPDVDWSEIKEGDHVEMDMEYVLDYFTSTTEDGSERSRKYTYPKLEKDADGYYEIVDVIAINIAKPKEFYLYDDLCDATYDWWIGNTEKVNGDPIHIDGIVQKLDNDQIEFHEEYLEDMGFTASEISDTQYELVVVSQDNPKWVIIAGVVIMLVGLAGIAVITIKK